MIEWTKSFVAWLEVVQTGLAYMGLTIPMLGVQVLGALLVICGAWVLLQAQRSKDNAFDAGAMFQDDRNRTSSAKFLSVIAGLASVWCVVYLTVSGKLEAWLFIGWLGVLVLGKVGADWIDATKRGPAPAPPQGGQ